MDELKTLETEKPNWEGIIEEWKASGLTKAEFCRVKNIDRHRFNYHSVKRGVFSRPKVEMEKTNGSEGTENFAKVVCVENDNDSKKGTLTIHLDCGGRIELENGFDTEALKKVLKVAKEIC